MGMALLACSRGNEQADRKNEPADRISGQPDRDFCQPDREKASRGKKTPLPTLGNGDSRVPGWRVAAGYLRKSMSAVMACHFPPGVRKFTFPSFQ